MCIARENTEFELWLDKNFGRLEVNEFEACRVTERARQVRREGKEGFPATQGGCRRSELVQRLQNRAGCQRAKSYSEAAMHCCTTLASQNLVQMDRMVTQAHAIRLGLAQGRLVHA